MSRFFFNPMWSHFRDGRHQPGGSYYYASGKDVVQYWHVFDQVVVRPDLMCALDCSSVRFPTEAGGFRLIDSRNRPNKKTCSDHLPLVFEVNIPKENDSVPRI